MAQVTNESEIPFKSVVNQILRRDGTDTELVGLATDLVAFINDRLRQAWSHEFWPQTTRSEQKNFYNVYCAGQEYTPGDIIFQDPSYLICVTATEDSPEDAPDSWQVVDSSVEFDFIIPLWQNGATVNEVGSEVIHRVKCVSMRNPLRTSTPGYLYYNITNQGIIVSTLAGSKVWVQYQVEPNEFTLNEVQEGQVYQPRIPFGVDARPADVVYDPVSGFCYMPVQNATQEDSFMDKLYWKRIGFPKFLERYVVHGAYADWLASEGSTAKSANEDQYAEKILFDLMDIHAPQEHVNQTVTYRKY